MAAAMRKRLHPSLPCDGDQHMRGGCPVGCCICAARNGEQVVVGRLPSSSAAWPGKVLGGGRVQRRLLGTDRERELAWRESSGSTHPPTHHPPQESSGAHLLVRAWWVGGWVVGVKREGW